VYDKTGRAPRIPKLSEFGPGRSKKGGIDWYRYQVDVLPYLLDDFEQFQKQVGSEALLMQDRAPAHRSPHHDGIWEAWQI